MFKQAGVNPQAIKKDKEPQPCLAFYGFSPLASELYAARALV